MFRKFTLGNQTIHGPMTRQELNRYLAHVPCDYIADAQGQPVASCASGVVIPSEQAVGTLVVDDRKRRASTREPRPAPELTKRQHESVAGQMEPVERVGELAERPPDPDVELGVYDKKWEKVAALLHAGWVTEDRIALELGTNAPKGLIMDARRHTGEVLQRATYKGTVYVRFP